MRFFRRKQKRPAFSMGACDVCGSPAVRHIQDDTQSVRLCGSHTMDDAGAKPLSGDIVEATFFGTPPAPWRAS